MSTLLKGGSVFDGSGAPLAKADVRLAGGVITHVGHGLPAADETLDVTGKTLMPGLIDAHVHAVISSLDAVAQSEEPFSFQFYAAQRNLERLLDTGFTTVRDAGGADLGVKHATEQGLIDGPDLRIAITILSQTGGHADHWHANGATAELFVTHPGRPSAIVDGPEEMRKKVRELLRAGADVIKICTSGGVSSPRDEPQHAQFTIEEIEMAVRETTAVGSYVMAHAQGKSGILNAVRAGVRSIEHGIYADNEVFDAMAHAGTWLVPTMAAPVELVRAIEGGLRVVEPVRRKAYEVLATHRAMLEGAVAAGVKIALGTDSGVFEHGLNHTELQHLRDVGMTPQQVLVAATSSAADLIGTTDRGVLGPGKRADLLVVDEDPFEFGRFPEKLAAVMKQGTVVRGGLARV